jgi:hypothetical protein
MAPISALLQSIIIFFTGKPGISLFNQLSHSQRTGMVSESMIKKQTGTPLLVMGFLTTMV